MSDDRTPADLRREVLRARAAREEAIRRESLMDATDRDSEPSVRVPVSVFERAMRRGYESIPPSIRSIPAKMNSPRGRIAAIVTGGLALIGGALRVIAWFEEQGFLR